MKAVITLAYVFVAVAVASPVIQGEFNIRETGIFLVNQDGGRGAQCRRLAERWDNCVKKYSD